MMILFDADHVIALRKSGRNPSYVRKFDSFLKEAGFENIEVRKYAVPLNAWPPGKKNKRLGSMVHLYFTRTIHILSVGVFSEAFGWSKEESELLANDVLTELETPDVHSFTNL